MPTKISEVLGVRGSKLLEKIDNVLSSFLIEVYLACRDILKTDHIGVLVRCDRLREYRGDRRDRIARMVLSLGL